MLRRQQQPTGAAEKKDEAEAPPGARRTKPDVERRGPQKEAGPRRNPPPRKRSYPPIGRGARSFSQSSKPLEGPRPSSAKLSQWAAALQAPGSRSLGSPRKAGSGWSWHLSPLVYIRPKSARSLPRVGQADGGRDGSARSLGVGGGRGGWLEAFCEVSQFSAASQGAAPRSPASPWGGGLISDVNSPAHPTESEIQG